MTTNTNTILTPSQQAAADEFFKFMLSDKQELLVTAPAGCGKTFLIAYLYNKIIPKYVEICKLMGRKQEYNQIAITATTNKACGVISDQIPLEVKTIHNFLSLRVFNDYSTGKTKLAQDPAVKRNYGKFKGYIVFIDECSMINKELHNFIKKSLKECKIVYLGDDCQLAPVNEGISPIFTSGIQKLELIEQVRQGGHKEIQDLCNTFRQAVNNNVWPTEITITPGIVDLLTPEEVQEEIKEKFKKSSLDQRILCFTNKNVIAYNDFINKDVRQIDDVLQKDRYFFLNDALELTTPQGHTCVVPVDCTVKIQEILNETVDCYLKRDSQDKLECKAIKLSTPRGSHIVFVPKNNYERFLWLKYYKEKKDWKPYYDTKGTLPDLRSTDVSTVHKAQGSTIDTVYIDLNDLNSCVNKDELLRLYYVAISRAKEHVVFFGNYPKGKFVYAQ